MTLPATNTSSFPMMYERFLVEPRIVDDSAEVLRDHTDARGLAFELSTFVARATVASHGPR